MSSQQLPSMTRERWAGVIFIAAAFAIILLIVFTLGSSSSRSLRFTALFSEGKGLKIGDKVHMSGVAIGEVDHIELSRSGDRVAVRLKITPEHREKVLANAIAYIADPTLPNVSGQKVVEIYNDSTPSGPMQNQATIDGKDSIFELKAWQIGGQVEEWGKSMVTASEDLKKTAKQLTDDARTALGNLTEGVTESIKEGVGEAITEGLSGEPSEGSDEGPEAGSVSPSPNSDDTGTSPSATSAQPSLDGTQIAGKLNEFLKQLGEKGGQKFSEMASKWKELQTQISPMIEKLAESGKEFLSKQLETLMGEIEKQMDEMEKLHPPSPDDKNAPVAI